LIEEHYAAVVIPADKRAGLRAAIYAGFDELVASARPELEAKTKRVRQIQDQQDTAVRAHLSGKLSLEALGRVQEQLDAELEATRRDIAVLSCDYAEQKLLIDDCLVLARDPRDFYRRSGPDAIAAARCQT
jgi:hypothetical protein